MRHFLFILSLLLFTSFSSQAQNCGTRFNSASFTNINTSTLTYSPRFTFTGAVAANPLQADIYEPAGDTANNRPLVIVSFGGGFTSGSRTDPSVTNFCNELAGRGYVAAGIDYRTGLENFSAAGYARTVYRAIQDVAAAVRFFKLKSDSLGIDTNQIFLAGFSAGAVASLHVAYLQNNELGSSTIDTSGIGDMTSKRNEGPTNRVKVVFSAAGSISNLNWLNGETTALFSYHNNPDPTVPYGAATVFGNPSFGSGVIHPYLDNINTTNILLTTTLPSAHLPAVGTPLADTIAAFWLRNMVAQTNCDNLVIVRTSNKVNAHVPAVTVFPNPAKEHIQLLGAENIKQLSLVNTLGQSLPLEVNHSGYAKLPKLAAGAYVLLIQTDNHLHKQKLFIQP